MIKIGTMGELRHSIKPFTDECPINELYMSYEHSVTDGGRVEFKTEKAFLDTSAIEVVLSRLNAQCGVTQSLIKEARSQLKALTGRPS